MAWSHLLIFTVLEAPAHPPTLVSACCGVDVFKSDSLAIGVDVFKCNYSN